MITQFPDISNVIRIYRLENIITQRFVSFQLVKDVFNEVNKRWGIILPFSVSGLIHLAAIFDQLSYAKICN